MTIHSVPEIPLPEGNLATQTKGLLDRMLGWQSNIEEALAHAEDAYSFDDIVSLVLTNQAKFHDFGTCFCITQLVQFPQFTNLHFFIAGGDLQEIRALLVDFKALAESLGCKHLTFSGRAGWARALKEDGWKHVFTTMYLEV